MTNYLMVETLGKGLNPLRSSDSVLHLFSRLSYIYLCFANIWF